MEQLKNIGMMTWKVVIVNKNTHEINVGVISKFEFSFYAFPSVSPPFSQLTGQSSPV